MPAGHLLPVPLAPELSHRGLSAGWDLSSLGERGEPGLATAARACSCLAPALHHHSLATAFLFVFQFNLFIVAKYTQDMIYHFNHF